jgi:hypothetical protein
MSTHDVNDAYVFVYCEQISTIPATYINPTSLHGIPPHRQLNTLIHTLVLLFYRVCNLSVKDQLQPVSTGFKGF